MTQSEWDQLLRMLTNLGLQLVSVDRTGGLVTLRVPPIGGTGHES